MKKPVYPNVESLLAKRKPPMIYPKTRADCKKMCRPCVITTCRYNLYVDQLKKNKNLKPSEMTVSCALDEAERGGMKLEDIRLIFGLSRERIRQIIEYGLRRMRFVNLEEDKREDKCS